MTKIDISSLDDARIILDALNLYREWMENDDHAPSLDSFPYTLDDVDRLIGFFDDPHLNKET